jgi:hypothetical protein
VGVELIPGIKHFRVEVVVGLAMAILDNLGIPHLEVPHKEMAVAVAVIMSLCLVVVVGVVLVV